MALVHELPEYTGPLATVGDQAAPTVEKPEFKLSTLVSDQGKTQIINKKLLDKKQQNRACQQQVRVNLTQPSS